MLIRAVAEKTAAHDLARFFSPEIARQITTAEQEVRVGTGQVRDAAILMVDIRGFTRLATTIAPDDLICLLAEYQSRLVPIIQRHGGTIDKFMGDGIMATFGAAVTSATYAADALKSVDDIMDSASAWGAELQQAGKPPLQVGAAVATGRIIFGAVGDKTRLEYTVIGDAVNLSAKLEKHTKSEGVKALCTAETFEIAARQGYRSPLNLAPAKSSRIEGVARPIDIVILAP
jgi:adenylate cyclase